MIYLKIVKRLDIKIKNYVSMCLKNRKFELHPTGIVEFGLTNFDLRCL